MGCRRSLCPWLIPTPFICGWAVLERSIPPVPPAPFGGRVRFASLCPPQKASRVLWVCGDPAKAWRGGGELPGGRQGRVPGALRAIPRDAAEHRTPAPSSAEPQPSSGARRPQLPAQHSCSWDPGRDFQCPQASCGLCPPGPEAHTHARAHAGATGAQLQPCGCPQPPAVPPGCTGTKRCPRGAGSIPGGAGLSPAPRSPRSSSSSRPAAPWADGEPRARSEGSRLSPARSGGAGRASRDLQGAV